MKNFLTLNSQLNYCRLDVCIAALKDTFFDAWIGAVLRNNLLYAMEQIYLDNEKLSLREFITKIPLSDDHPLYSELVNGFPQPYYLYVKLPAKKHVNNIQVREGEQLNISFVLVRKLAEYIPLFIQAFDYMCNKGIGRSSSPFRLIEIREVSSLNENHLLYSEGKVVSGDLLFSNALALNNPNVNTDILKVVFESPGCLIRTKKAKANPGYQEKSNAFPGFYQLVRSAAYRLEKLHALYVEPTNTENFLASHACIDEYVDRAAYIQLEYASIQKVNLLNSHKEGVKEQMPLAGYIGELVFKGDFSPCYDLLKFMEYLGVGHELTYGFGKYKIELL